MQILFTIDVMSSKVSALSGYNVQFLCTLVPRPSLSKSINPMFPSNTRDKV